MLKLLEIAVQCEAGKYAVNGDESDCVTAEECAKTQGQYAYANGECLAIAPASGEGVTAPTNGGDATNSYACDGNTYLLIEIEARCVEESKCPGLGRDNLCLAKEKCTDYWYEVGKVRKCVDASGCAELSGYVYEVDGSKLCLTEDQCKGSGYNGYLRVDGDARSCVPAS